MSHSATKWAIEQRGLKPSAKIVLWHLADRYHPDNGCFPSQENLAHDCELSRSGLNGVLRLLEEKGLIAREVRRDAKTNQVMSTRYRFPFDTDWQGHVEKSDTGPSPENGDSRVQNSDTNLVREPVRERERTRTREAKLEAAWAAITKVWPSGSIGNSARGKDALAGLSDADLDAAVDRAQRFLAALRAAKRSHVPSVATYAKNREFEHHAPPPNTAPDAIELKAYSAPLWRLYWRAVDQALNGPDRERGQRRVTDVAGWLAKGATLPAAAIPTDDETKGLCPVRLGSDEHLAWQTYCDRIGLRLPTPTHVPVVFAPTSEPPALDVTASPPYRLAAATHILIRSKAWWWRQMQRVAGGKPIAFMAGKNRIDPLERARRTHGNDEVLDGPLPLPTEIADMVGVSAATLDWERLNGWIRERGSNIDLWPDPVIWVPRWVMDEARNGDGNHHVAA